MTALIAQLYREQRSAEDRVMFDAYQNGGMVDGKPVTDSRIRSYIANRRDGFTKDDPAYDEWNNRLIQIDFRIGEEKVTLAFQQGKVGAGAVASYYRGQLGKIPKDSAFYREVAGRAAQWAKSAAGAARGRARAGLERSLEGKQNGVAKTWANFSNIEAYITDAAKRAGLIAGNQSLTDADATRLQELFAAGIVGPKGTTITFDDWRNASVAAYKAFDTQISINKQLNRGTKELTEAKGKFLDQGLVRINTIDDRAAYELARDNWLEEVGSAQGDPKAILEATAKYAALLGNIKANASKNVNLDKNDSEFIGGLTNEINAATTGKFSGPTVFDLQSTSTEAVTDGDGQQTADSIQKVIADANALDTGAAYYGQAEFGGGFKVNYFAPGAALDPFGRKGLGPDTQPAILNINGKPTQVMLKGQPVKAQGLVDPNGQPVQNITDPNTGAVTPVSSLSASEVASLLANGFTRPEGDGAIVGYVFQQGGKTTYGVYDTDGNIKFTTQNPWEGAFGTTEGGFSVTAGTSFAGDGTTVVTAPPAINIDLSNTAGLLVDPNVSPSDLRDAAANAPSDSAAQALLAVADRRQKSNEEEQRTQTHGPQETMLGDIRQNVNDFVRQAIGVLSDAAPPSIGAAKAGGVPSLGGWSGAPPSVMGPPPDATPSPAAPPSSFVSDSVTFTPPSLPPNPDAAPTTPPPGSGSGAGVGGATADLLDKYLNPPKPPGSHPGAGLA